MGLWGRIKKKAKKVGKQVKRSSKQVGSQIKRSAAVAAPALLGPGLGDKVGIALANKNKSALKGLSRVSNVTGRIVQIAGTIVTTVFAGPIAGSAVYRGTALLRQLSQHETQEAKYKAGMTTTRGHNVVWKKQPLRIAEGIAAGVGVAAVGAIAGGTSLFASGSSMASGIMGGGTAAAGGTGASAAMQTSTAAMVAGETGGVAAAGGSSLLTTLGTGLGTSAVSMLLPRLFGAAGTSTGGVSTGGTEVYTGEGGGAAGETGLAGVTGEVTDFLSGDIGGIPTGLIIGAIIIIAIYYWK